jgi:hypothetical protein
MNIDIEIENGVEEYSLFNYFYISQRYFASGINRITGETKKFITTKGFDQILMSSKKGIEYNFTKKHFNPYLCDKEKLIFRESQLIENQKIIKDIGPSNFSGNYEVVKKNQPYKDNFYFETVPFKVEGFDLFRYQNDDLYFTQYQSDARNKLPQLVNVFDANLYEKINIVHAVNDNGDDYFDLNCLIRICDAELGYPDKNSFYSIIRAAGFEGVFKPHKIGPLEFVNLKDILQFKNDCGNAYIQKNINKKLSKRKFAFRYLYEYFKIIESLCSKRRKQSIGSQTGPKEYKKEEFLPIFYDNTIMDFKIVYFKDIFTIERKHELKKIVPGDPIFYIDGHYDFNTGAVSFYNFKSTGEIVKKIKEKLGTTTSIRFAKVISEWLPNTFGYIPLIVKLSMSQKANPSPLSDNLTLYTIPIREEGSNEVFGAETYVNLFEYFANFGIHIPQIRNMLNANRFSSKIFTLLDTTFPVYNVCKDTRRKIHEFDEINDQDNELINLMFPVSYGVLVISHILEKAGISKNSYWYSNLNRLCQSFPPGDAISTVYTPPELQEYLNEE